MTDRRPGLTDAYSVKTPDDNRRLYADWAASYDDGFAGPQDYLLPGHVARAFAAMGGRGPALDIGAGTGLLGDHLARLGIGPVDGVDLSPEMLAVAGAKGVYARLFAGDMTVGLDLPGGAYSGIVSSGTFTIGHLGPAVLAEVVRLAAPGAVIAVSVNRAHFEAEPFTGALARLAGAVRTTATTVPALSAWCAYSHENGPHCGTIAHPLAGDGMATNRIFKADLFRHTLRHDVARLVESRVKCCRAEGRRHRS